MPATWSMHDNFKLLLSILELNNVKSASWPIVAAKMGDGFTAEACRQHYHKIKRENAAGNGASASASPGSTKATGKGRKRKAADANVDDDAQGASTNGMPARVKKEAKLKRERAHSLAIFKADPVDAEQIDVDADDALYEDSPPGSDE